MAMTREEKATRNEIANRLGEQGYATYGRLLMLFELRLTTDPRVLGYMIPGKGVIVINRTLEPHQILLTIRHEILHEYLSHELRLLEHLGEKHPELMDASLEDITDNKKLKDLLYSIRKGQYSVANVAGDYEISNRGYTEQDKEDLRHIKFNGQIVSGLVTEDKHPDWVDLTVEEMFDKLVDEMEDEKNQGTPPDEGNSDKGDPGEDSDQSDDSNEGDQGDESDTGDQGEGDDQSGEDDESESDQSDGQGNKGSGKGSSSKDSSSDNSNDESGDESDDEDGSSDGDSDDEGDEGSDGGSDGSGDSSNDQKPENSKAGKGKSQKITVIRGTFKNGKFYDLNGNEITPR